MSDLIEINDIKNNYFASNCAEKFLSGERLQKGILYMFVQYLTLRHLPPLRFHCVRGCRDRTQDCYDFGIDRIFCTVCFERKERPKKAAGC